MGDKINERQLNRIFYLNMNQEKDSTILRLRFFKLRPVASLRSDELIGLEHATEKFGANLYLNDISTFKINQDIPYMISIVYHGYSSSLYFKIKAVGDETKPRRTTILAEPMTLCRF
ncbi:hypothetical protein BDF21DRAFT_426010 [Thamnidium elegans]|nr:hypothetical protein BDF21DRAFT_426010 [Thamnidium elegans]